MSKCHEKIKAEWQWQFWLNDSSFVFFNAARIYMIALQWCVIWTDVLLNNLAAADIMMTCWECKYIANVLQILFVQLAYRLGSVTFPAHPSIANDSSARSCRPMLQCCSVLQCCTHRLFYARVGIFIGRLMSFTTHSLSAHYRLPAATIVKWMIRTKWKWTKHIFWAG